MKKFLIIAAGAVVVVLIAFTLFIKFYITPERVKSFVVPTAEKSLNRKVDMGDISIGLLKGISLSDFAIKESDGESDFVKFKEFVLKIKLLPLLSKQVIIDELKLVSPEIKIHRGKNGKFNFEDIGQKKEDAVEKAKEDDAPEEAGGLPISLLVNKVSVKDAKFSLSDLLNELPDLKSSADIDISIKSLDGSNLSTEGSIDIKVDSLLMKNPSAKSIKDLSAGIKYGLNINLESLDILIDRADLDVQGIKASIKGDIRNTKTSPDINLAVTVPKVKNDELLKLASLFTDLRGLALSGDLAADVKLTGAVKKLETMKARGSILLEKVGIKYEEIDAMLDGNITFDEKLLNIDMKSTIDKNTAEIKGSVRNYMKNQDIELNIYAKELALDQLIPAGKSEKKTTAGKKPGKAGGKPSKEAEPLDLKLAAKGEIRVDSALYKNMAMNDFLMQFQFKNNRLNISKMSAKTGKGTLNLNSIVDLSKRGYTYKLKSTIDSVHAEEFINALVPKAKDTIFGTFSLDLDANGAGTLMDNIKKNLIANGNFNIKDGKIENAEITRKLSKFLSVKELETINLKKAEGTVKVNNGVARLDSIFESDDLSMDPSGNIGLDETLDLAFDLRLSPRLTGKAMSSSISKYIKSDEGWGMIPLMVTGTFGDPGYMVDIEKAGKRIIKKEAGKLLDKLLKKDEGEKATTKTKKEGEEKNEIKQVEDLLKGIFK